jgi:hypothetical protein
MCTEIACSVNLTIPQRGGLGDRSTPWRCSTRPITEWSVKGKTRLGTLLLAMAIPTICFGAVELSRRSSLYGRISDDHARRARKHEETQAFYAATFDVPGLPRGDVFYDVFHLQQSTFARRAKRYEELSVYHTQMARKWRCASNRPWLLPSGDPPAPLEPYDEKNQRFVAEFDFDGSLYSKTWKRLTGRDLGQIDQNN